SGAATSGSDRLRKTAAVVKRSLYMRIVTVGRPPATCQEIASPASDRFSHHHRDLHRTAPCSRCGSLLHAPSRRGPERICSAPPWGRPHWHRRKTRANQPHWYQSGVRREEILPDRTLQGRSNGFRVQFPDSLLAIMAQRSCQLAIAANFSC
ncbi:MAG: hypothetical protein ACI9UA_004000, partial [Pseudoalteromonas tetraodonis]